MGISSLLQHLICLDVLISNQLPHDSGRHVTAVELLFSYLFTSCQLFLRSVIINNTSAFDPGLEQCV